MVKFITFILICSLLVPVSGADEFIEEEFYNYFKEMHSGIYKAFEYSRDEEIYNCLYGSFTGEELDTQFFEFLKTIKEFQSLGYRNYVKKIEYEKLAIEKKKKDYIKIFVKWKVYGLVKHLLHEHNRINTYEAVYRLEKPEAEEDWKIAGTQIISGERIIFPRRWYDKKMQQIMPEEKVIIESVNTPL